MPDSLKLTEFEDFEFLHHLEEQADTDGWTSTDALAAVLGLDVKYPVRNVGSRCGWLRRLGVLERDEERGASFYRLTPIGRQLLHGKLTKAQEKALTAGDGRLLALTRALSGQLESTAAEGAALMHRQWRYSYARRR
jgi:hypothetical protein